MLPKMVWMEVDLGDKELPIRQEDSAAELAKKCGVTESTVLTSAYWARRGYIRRYISVWIGD